MKKLKLLAGAFIAVFAMNAQAGLIVDTVEQHVFLSAGLFSTDTHEYTHVLGETGEDPFALGSAVSAQLEIDIKDDRDKWYQIKSEFIAFVVEEFDFDTGGIQWDFGASDFVADLDINALAALNEDGELEVSVTSLWGDFYVGNSVLTVVTEVPEPAVLALFGIGLVGMGVARRRKA